MFNLLLGYARVSTADQDLEGQRRRLREAGAQRVFEDVVSGRQFVRTGPKRADRPRPGWRHCLRRAPGPVQPLVTRTARNGRTLQGPRTGLSLLERKARHRLAAGELVFHVFGSIAHFGRRLIAERTRDGLAAARARGKRPGRPELDADKRAAALALVDSGLSPTRAARQLGLGRPTLYRELARGP